MLTNIRRLIMIDFIKGNVEYFDKGYVVVSCGGIGYRITAGEKTIASLAAKKGEVTVYTYMSVRDDAISLMGFETKAQLSMFYSLINVTGIGPKMAVNIIDNIDISSLVTAIVSSDINTLSKVPGLGKKTAQRLVLELKDKLTESQITQSFTQGEIEDIINIPEKGVKADAIEALESLGYSRSEALKAVAAVYSEGDSVEKTIKAALRKMI